MNSDHSILGCDPEKDPDTIPQSEKSYRAQGIAAIIGVLAVGGMLVLFTGMTGGGAVTRYRQLYSGKGVTDSASLRSGIGPSRLVLSCLRPLDTIYTTDSVYLEVNLELQNVTVHRRDGEFRSFLISSGTPFIREGMVTPSGVFTVQNMTPLALSRQFNNARLHHWIGVQGGVGFHGLDGTGYYGYLGKRPSSHGCMRMARDQIREMYTMVHPGALIMVHSGSPARVVAFCDMDDTVGAELIDSASVYNRDLGKKRLQTLMNGQKWIDPQPRLVHLARQRLRWGMQIGDAKRIPRQQIPDLPSFSAARHLRQPAYRDRSHVGTLDVVAGVTLLAEDSLDAHSRDSTTVAVRSNPENDS